MPRYSKPSAYPRSIEFLGEHGLDLVAVMQRRASVGHDDFADVEAFKDFRRGVGYKAYPNLACLNRISFDHLDRQMVDGGTRDCDAATAPGVDIGAGKHADLERGIAAERYPDMAELVGAVDLRRNQPHASDQIGLVVPANPHRRARIEFQDVDGRHFSIQFDLVVDCNPKHRGGLPRGRSSDDGPD